MKAVIWNHYGSADHLSYEDVKEPTPKANEVLIHVHASTVTAGDCEIRSLRFPLFINLMFRLYFGFIRPRNRILGQELSGEVVEIGKAVTKFKVGDQVFGSTGMQLGAYGEYLALPETSQMGIITKKPDFITDEAAAAMVVGGMEALHFLSLCNLTASSRILINGAGGSIGTVAIQLAKHYGAHVTAIDSKEKLAMTSNIGADVVIDYKTTDLSKLEPAYDVILDIVGKIKLMKGFKKLNKSGLFLVANPRLKHRFFSKLTKLGTKKMVVKIAKYTEEGLNELLRLYGDGRLKIEIDQMFPLKEVAKAHHYVESGAKKGNVVIVVKE